MAISIEIIAYFNILAIIWSTTVAVYPENGLVSELIKVLFSIPNGEKSIYTDLVFNFPQYNVKENDSCFSREILTYFEAITNQFSSQINKPIFHEEVSSKAITTKDQLHSLVFNLDLCQQKKIHSEMEAISVFSPGQVAKGYTRYQSQPYHCVQEDFF